MITALLFVSVYAVRAFAPLHLEMRTHPGHITKADKKVLDRFIAECVADRVIKFGRTITTLDCTR